MANIPLNRQNIPSIASVLPCPRYDLDTIKTGIVHIGVGGFHRSHQAYYIHQLLGKHQETDWGICGIGLREADRNIYRVLTNQDGLYTLITQHPDGKIACEVIGAVRDFILAVDTPDAAIDKDGPS